MQLPRFTLLESGSLLVSPAHRADAGTYTCLATNSRGVDEASADLVVWGKALPVALPVSPLWDPACPTGSWLLPPAVVWDGAVWGCQGWVLVGLDG